MEQLSRLLQPYKELVGAAAGLLTSLQMFTGVFMCNDIRKAGASDAFPVMPFLGGTVFSVINLQYASIIRDDAMIKVSFLGLFTSIIYMTFYYYYTTNENKNKVWGKMGIGGAIAALCIAYCKYEDPNLVEFRFGIINTIFIFALVGAPMLDLGTIIRNKSVGNMPFAMILSGTVISFLWLLYGIILNNSIIVFQNVVMFIMSAFQLSLFAIYPNKGPVAQKGDKKKKK